MNGGSRVDDDWESTISGMDVDDDDYSTEVNLPHLFGNTPLKAASSSHKRPHSAISKTKKTQFDEQPHFYQSTMSHPQQQHLPSNHISHPIITSDARPSTLSPPPSARSSSSKPKPKPAKCAYVDDAGKKEEEDTTANGNKKRRNQLKRDVKEVFAIMDSIPFLAGGPDLPSARHVYKGKMNNTDKGDKKKKKSKMPNYRGFVPRRGPTATTAAKPTRATPAPLANADHKGRMSRALSSIPPARAVRSYSMSERDSVVVDCVETAVAYLNRQVRERAEAVRLSTQLNHNQHQQRQHKTGTLTWTVPHFFTAQADSTMVEPLMPRQQMQVAERVASFYQAAGYTVRITYLSAARPVVVTADSNGSHHNSHLIVPESPEFITLEICW